MIEIIASSIKDAQEIEAGGGERIELVSALSEGGLTPSCGLICGVLKAVRIPVYVMLRPMSKSFVYESHHLTVMREDALAMEQIGVTQVVVGILDEKGLPDIEKLEKVLGETKLKATFHRAFDASSNLSESLKILNDYSRVTHILTSGGPGKLTDNLDTMRELLPKSRAKIVLGSGITTENATQIKNTLNITDQVDVHVGTAVRGGKVHADVDPTLVNAFVSKWQGL